MMTWDPFWPGLPVRDSLLRPELLALATCEVQTTHC